MLGKTISHYRILEKLGEGGMGVVYKAEDTKLGRMVALKFLPPELTRDPEANKRFIQEAKAASALDHPNICNVHEIDETGDGRTFIAMACYDGESLKAKIERGPLKLEEALDIASQVAQGLAKAHERKIIHRDIKPGNILITKDGLVKIVDFGLAKLAGAKVTKTGATLGTAQYMSPEQACGEEVDARSDIFSLGTVLYEMLAGKHAFPGEYDQATIYSILNQEPEPVTALRSGVPIELDRIIKKALAKQPPERYQHADDLIVDLKECAAKSISGKRKESALSPRGKRRPGLRFWIPAAFVVAAVLLIIFLNPFNFEIGFKKTVAAKRKSVAVLPFTNMSGDKEDEFFSDGITEDIIAQLSNIAELKVISRTSVMRYKNTIKSMRDIAKELNVATILEGSVRRSGNQVRIVAQLINATNDEHLWAQTYDKEMTQIFTIQSDVAQQIASALQAKLSPREREQLGKMPTNSVDAYTLYLKGREYYYRYIKRDNEYAIELFKEAVALDPNYALAYAGLGDAYAQRSQRFGFPPAWVDSSIAASRKAIAVDPTLAEAYKALGLAYYNKRWIRKSIETYRKAIELNPKYFFAVGNIGDCNMIIGKIDETLPWYFKAIPMDPMLPNYYASLGESYSMLGDDERAVRLFDKASALKPDCIDALLRRSRMHMRRREYQEALDQAQRILSIQDDYLDGLRLAGSAELLRGNLAEAERYFEKGVAVDSIHGPNTELGYVYWKTGRKDRARELFARSLVSDRQQLEQGNEDPEIPHDLARLSAIQGNTAEGLKWLQKSVDAGGRGYRWIEVDPLLENLHSDDAFTRIIVDVRAKVDEMRWRVEQAEKQETSSASTL